MKVNFVSCTCTQVPGVSQLHCCRIGYKPSISRQTRVQSLSQWIFSRERYEEPRVARSAPIETRHVSSSPVFGSLSHWIHFHAPTSLASDTESQQGHQTNSSCTPLQHAASETRVVETRIDSSNPDLGNSRVSRIEKLGRFRSGVASPWEFHGVYSSNPDLGNSRVSRIEELAWFRSGVASPWEFHRVYSSNPDLGNSRVSRIEKLGSSDLELRVHAIFDNPGILDVTQRFFWNRKSSVQSKISSQILRWNHCLLQLYHC